MSMYDEFLNKPSVVIIDHYLPLKNGLEVTEYIKEINKNCNIIFTSGDRGVKKKAMEAGAAIFLEKPFSPKKIVEIIELFNKNSS